MRWLLGIRRRLHGPGDVATQSNFEVGVSQHADRINHLLMEARVRHRWRVAALKQNDRMVEVGLVPAPAIGVDGSDFEYGPARAGLERLIWNLGRGNPALEARHGGIEGKNLYGSVDWLAGLSLVELRAMRPGNAGADLVELAFPIFRESNLRALGLGVPAAALRHRLHCCGGLRLRNAGGAGHWSLPA